MGSRAGLAEAVARDAEVEQRADRAFVVERRVEVFSAVVALDVNADAGGGDDVGDGAGSPGDAAVEGGRAR